MGQHLEQQVAALGFAQVDGDAALVAVPHHEVLGIFRGFSPDAAAGVAGAWRLDLHHVGAQPGERLGAGSARLVLGHVQNSQTVQSRHGLSPCVFPTDKHIGGQHRNEESGRRATGGARSALCWVALRQREEFMSRIFLLISMLAVAACQPPSDRGGADAPSASVAPAPGADACRRRWSSFSASRKA